MHSFNGSRAKIIVVFAKAHQGNTLLNKDGWWAVMIISFDFLASVPAQSDSLRQSHHEIRSNRGTYLATTWRANFYRVDSPKVHKCMQQCHNNNLVGTTVIYCNSDIFRTLVDLNTVLGSLQTWFPPAFMYRQSLES